MSELDAVSKTKIRGVLALLKHAEILQAFSKGAPRPANVHDLAGSSECDEMTMSRSRDSIDVLSMSSNRCDSPEAFRTASSESLPDSECVTSPEDINPVKLRLDPHLGNYDMLRDKHDKHVKE